MHGERPRDALEVVRRIEASLAGGGFRVTRDSVAGRQTVIGRRSRFRLRPPGARLPVFVLVGVFKNDASPDHLDRFLDEARQYATTTRGGLGRATCAVAVAVVDAAEGAGDWAAKPPVHRGSCASLPVLVDLGRGRVVFPDHADALGALVWAHVGPSLGPG